MKVFMDKAVPEAKLDQPTLPEYETQFKNFLKFSFQNHKVRQSFDFSFE